MISPVGVISIVKDREEMQIPRRLVEPCIKTASAGCCKIDDGLERDCALQCTAPDSVMAHRTILVDGKLWLPCS